MKKYIDADNSLSAIDKAIKKYADNDDVLEFLSEIRFAVIGQPAADVEEVRHGEWRYAFERRTKSGVRFTYRCSCCNRLEKRDSDEPPIFEIYPYCHCGAKMDGYAGK